ncbi:MAG: EAL domain-containing protein [Betaproteobacteria bacterium]|nr:EAL domain-containing protein [Betaproteobacteria bacterium]
MTRILRHHRLAYVILALGIVLSGVAWYIAGVLTDRRAQVEFNTRTQNALSQIERRAQRYVDLLHGLQGLFGHDPSVSRNEFSRYIGSVELQTRFPGVISAQYIRRVRDGEKEVYETSVRIDRSIAPNGYPDFSIQPAGTRAEYWVIHYLEPMAGNEAAFGYDIRTREEPRMAAERARDLGEPVATGVYRLVQDKPDETRPAMVVYLPVFEVNRRGRTAQQRTDELAGFVSILFRSNELFQSLSDTDNPSLQVQVYDVGPVGASPQAPSAANRLFPADSSVAAPDDHAVSRRISIAGRLWEIRFSDEGLDMLPIFRPLPLIALLASLLVTALLFVLLRTLSRSRHAAEQMADSATRELRDQLSFSRQLLEAIPNPVFFKDAKGRYISCNEAFEKFTNRSRSEYLGRTVLEVTSSDAARLHHEIESELLEKGGSRVYETSLIRTTDGRQMHAIFNKATFVDTSGKIAGLVGVIIDISERKALERTLSESNETLRSIIEASPLAIIARDLEGVVRLWNPAAEKLFGWTAEEVLGSPRSIVPPDMKEEVAEMRKQVEAGMMLSLEETKRVRRDGVVLDVSLSVAPIKDAAGKTAGTMVLLADVSRRKQAEAALRQSEAQLQMAMDAANMGSWFWDLETGNLTWSDGFGPLFGLPRSTFFASAEEFMESVHPDDRGLVNAGVRQALKHDARFDHECRIIWPDGSIHWVYVTGEVRRNSSGRAEKMIGITSDITVRKEAEQRIAYLAHHDVLTGLPNRLLLEDRIGQAIAHAHRNGTQIAVLFIDLDHFKTINDSLGHQLGDHLLKLVSIRIQACLREVDTVSRLGGDEFVIVIPELTETVDATNVAVKLLETLSNNFHLQTHDLHIGASIGISVYPNDGENAETLMRNADTAMYHAKENGRAQYQYFTSEMNAAAQQRMSLQVLLRRSLSVEGDFSLHYQPVFSAQDQTLVGFEVLLRWKNPAGITVRPAEFISVAEDSGLIVPIGEWLIREAFRTAARWQAEGTPMRIAINVSAIQLRRKSFADFVRNLLDETGADPRLIEMEITERVLVGGNEDAIRALRQIDALGIQLAIDDFGTGYSGLSYLKQFPIDTVKIDQSFVRDLTTDADDEAIVRAIIAMSKSLKLSVVAEGVEHAEQMDRLRELGCDLLQGYYFSRPVPLDEADRLLQRQQQSLQRRNAGGE